MVQYAQFRMSVCTRIVTNLSIPAHSTTLINVCISYLYYTVVDKLPTF